MEEAIGQARDSLSRCVKSPAFLDRFYELFVASSDDIRRKFANTDFPRQKKMLEDSLFIMLTAAGTTRGLAYKHLSKLAERHSRTQLDIHPDWYDTWLECLLKAVSENDPQYRPELAGAWRASLKDGIALMKARY